MIDRSLGYVPFERRRTRASVTHGVAGKGVRDVAKGKNMKRETKKPKKDKK